MATEIIETIFWTPLGERLDFATILQELRRRVADPTSERIHDTDPDDVAHLHHLSKL